MRLSSILSERFNISRRYAKSEIYLGRVKVEGSIVTKDIDIYLAHTNNIEYQYFNQNLEFDKDEFLLADYDNIKFIYKRAFMHSDRLRPTDNLTVSDIVTSFGDYRSLSRLDYEVDGIIGIVNPKIGLKRVKKYYLAIVEGVFPDTPITLSYSINAANRKQVKVNDDYTGYLTSLKLVDTHAGYSLISVELEKAARHQVRAFCNKIGYPIIGDKLYGGRDYPKLMLHCNKYDINDYSSTSKRYEQLFLNIFHNISDI